MAFQKIITHMKILFVVRSVGMGGATKQLAMTANALAEKGHSVTVYSYCWNTPYDGLSDKVRYVPSEIYGKLGEYLHSIPCIRKVVRKEKPDVVISWRANAGCFTRIATIGLSCKVVYSERTDPYMETSMFLKFATWVCGFSDGGVFQTEKARDYYKRLSAKSIVIPNPFEYKVLPPVVPLQERNKEIACVGRFFIVQKRQDIMLDAFKIIHDKYPNHKLVFYGDGIDIDKVKKLVHEKGLGYSVIFRGSVKDVISHIKNSRLLVLSSDYEGIPNVILEAFAAGTPVVSTDCSPGGARVLIEDGCNGFIVPIRDVNAIAKKAVQLIENDEMSFLFIDKGRDKLVDFKYEKITEKWNDYIQNFQ